MLIPGAYCCHNVLGKPIRLFLVPHTMPLCRDMPVAHLSKEQHPSVQHVVNVIVCQQWTRVSQQDQPGKRSHQSF